MKENFDPCQIVISREYFDQLIEMARMMDHPDGTKNHPNNTAVSRILRHARKYNRQLHNERRVEVETELVQKRLQRRRRAKIVKEYAGTGKKVYVVEGDHDWPAVVCGESRRNKLALRLMVMRNHKYSFEAVHINDIILSPRPSKV